MQKLLSFIVVVILISSCNKSKKSPANNDNHEPKAFAKRTFLSVTPMIDGAVYSQDEEGQLWYVKDGHAFKVKGSTGQLPYFNEITPSVDGSAYATTWEEGLWHLVSASASRVSESNQTSSNIQPSSLNNSGIFALYAFERKKRLEAEDRASDASDRAMEAEENARDLGADDGEQDYRR